MKRIKLTKSSVKQKVINIGFTCMILALVYPTMVYATSSTGSSTVTTSLRGLQDVLMSIVTSVGTLVAIWGILELSISMSSNDGTSMASALKRIAGGVIAMIAPIILVAIMPAVS